MADRDFGDQQEAANALLGGDREIGEDCEAVDTLVFDGGDDGDIGCSGAEFFGTL